MDHVKYLAPPKPEYQKPALEEQLAYRHLVGVPVSGWTPMLFDGDDFEGEAFDLKN